MSVHVEHLEDTSNLSDAFQVRIAVFQLEQGIPGNEDFDGRDQAAEQFIAYDDDTVIGTARYRLISEDTAKVERVAVLLEHRGKKASIAIMNEVARFATDQGLGRLTLDAQLTVSGLYESLGYEAEGDIFEEVGKPHLKMNLELPQPVTT